MEPVFAPSALRMPISRVRSVTETSIIFITPIPPTMREIPATSATNAVTPSIMEPNISERFNGFCCMNGASPRFWCRAFKICTAEEAVLEASSGSYTVTDTEEKASSGIPKDSAVVYGISNVDMDFSIPII